MMAVEKIVAIAEEHKLRFHRDGVKPKQMDPNQTFESLDRLGKLAHASFLAHGIIEYARDPKEYDKINRHLASMQVLVSCAGLDTLGDLMHTNRKKDGEMHVKPILLAVHVEQVEGEIKTHGAEGGWCSPCCQSFKPNEYRLARLKYSADDVQANEHLSHNSR